MSVCPLDSIHFGINAITGHNCSLSGVAVPVRIMQKKSDSNGGDRQYQINAMWIEMVSGHSDLAGNEESVEIDCRPILLSV